MGRFGAYVFSSIGQKKLMAISGLSWALFALSHMAGNLLLFCSPEAYNKYGHALVSNPAIYLAEAGLVLLFLSHVIFAIRTTRQNKKARKDKYVASKSGAKEASASSRTMIFQGIVVLVFVVWHLITFKFGPYYEVTYDGQTMRDLFKLIVEIFQQPLYFAWYVFAVIVLGFHLSHGVYSGLQSLGLQHPKYTPKVKIVSVIYGILVGLGFASQPLFVFFFH